MRVNGRNWMKGCLLSSEESRLNCLDDLSLTGKSFLLLNQSNCSDRSDFDMPFELEHVQGFCRYCNCLKFGKQHLVFCTSENLKTRKRSGLHHDTSGCYCVKHIFRTLLEASFGVLWDCSLQCF